MLAFTDHTLAEEGRADARMNFRTKSRIKETIQKAAALSGVDDSTFAMSAAYSHALEVVKEIKSELKDLKKNMEYVLENNDAMKSSLQTSLNSASSSSELETTLLDKIGKVENKMAIIENSQKSNTNKLTDVTEKTKNSSLSRKLLLQENRTVKVKQTPRQYMLH